MLPHFILVQSYVLIAVLALLEGPFLAIACGVGAGLGYLNPLVAYGILVFGDVAPDCMYYWLGRYGTTLPWVERFAMRTRLIRVAYEPLKELWHERPFITLGLAKLAYGIAPPIVVTAGLAKLPFSRFFPASLVTGSLFMGLLGGIGYTLALSYGYVNLATGAAPYIIGSLGFIVFCIYLFVMRTARHHFKKKKHQD